MLTGER